MDDYIEELLLSGRDFVGYLDDEHVDDAEEMYADGGESACLA